jgi:alpha-D-xyloside xylohydrolase
MKFLSGLLCVAVLVGCGSKTPEGSFVQSESGVVVTPASGSAKRVRLELRSDHIVHVTAVADENLALPASLIVTGARPAAVPFKAERQGDDLALTTPRLVAHVSLANGAVRFTDLAGNALLEESPARVLDKGVSQRFNPGSDEAFFGMGQHQNAQMNLNGEDVEIAQHNMDIGVPFVVSSRNYGVLWDNYSITRFGNPKPYALASRDLKIRDASGKEGGFTARYSVDGGAQARACREGHQLPVHPRPFQLAEGTAGAEGTGRRCAT